jgi:hypothetical protein
MARHDLRGRRMDGRQPLVPVALGAIPRSANGRETTWWGTSYH